MPVVCKHKSDIGYGDKSVNFGGWLCMHFALFGGAMMIWTWSGIRQ